MNIFEEEVTQNAKKINAFLENVLIQNCEEDEILRPEYLLKAIRHGTLNGGKRLRPFFVIKTAALFHADPKAALYVAAALEVLHCYSLIHDDLPAMDNDDMRRGLPTVHKAFDEATAILAGDALLTFAFSLLASDNNPLNDSMKILLTKKLANMAGMGGMVGGQALDMSLKNFNETDIITLQSMKTSLLFRFACEAGAILGAAEKQDQDRLAEFGMAIGLAFQLADDLLDVHATEQMLGKTPGKDAKFKKPTLIALHSEEWAKTQLEGLIENAQHLLSPYGEKADILREAANFIKSRQF